MEKDRCRHPDGAPRINVMPAPVWRRPAAGGAATAADPFLVARRRGCAGVCSSTLFHRGSAAADWSEW